jgi:hypothetical protein
MAPVAELGFLFRGGKFFFFLFFVNERKNKEAKLIKEYN